MKDYIPIGCCKCVFKLLTDEMCVLSVLMRREEAERVNEDQTSAVNWSTHTHTHVHLSKRGLYKDRLFMLIIYTETFVSL